MKLFPETGARTTDLPSAGTRHAVPFLGRISDTGMKLAYQLSEAGCSLGEPDLAHLAEISNRAKVKTSHPTHPEASFVNDCCKPLWTHT